MSPPELGGLGMLHCILMSPCTPSTAMVAACAALVAASRAAPKPAVWSSTCYWRCPSADLIFFASGP